LVCVFLFPESGTRKKRITKESDRPNSSGKKMESGFIPGLHALNKKQASAQKSASAGYTVPDIPDSNLYDTDDEVDKWAATVATSSASKSSTSSGSVISDAKIKLAKAAPGRRMMKISIDGSEVRLSSTSSNRLSHLKQVDSRASGNLVSKKMPPLTATSSIRIPKESQTAIKLKSLLAATSTNKVGHPKQQQSSSMVSSGLIRKRSAEDPRLTTNTTISNSIASVPHQSSYPTGLIKKRAQTNTHWKPDSAASSAKFEMKSREWSDNNDWGAMDSAIGTSAYLQPTYSPEVIHVSADDETFPNADTNAWGAVSSNRASGETRHGASRETSPRSIGGGESSWNGAKKVDTNDWGAGASTGNSWGWDKSSESDSANRSTRNSSSSSSSGSADRSGYGSRDSGETRHGASRETSPRSIGGGESSWNGAKKVDTNDWGAGASTGNSWGWDKSSESQVGYSANTSIPAPLPPRPAPSTVALARSGRGRGTHTILPAWMTADVPDLN
jgi:hypothetical protein